MKARTTWRVELIRLLIGASWVLLACSQPLEPDAEVAISRVVVITIDTLRADHLGCYGGDWARTPHLDRLAARGVRFEFAIAPTPMTQPSHATLFTGLDPPRHGLRSNGAAQLPDDLPMLAERMQEAGFATAGFVGAVLLEGYYGFDRGFDHFDDRMESRDSGPLLGFDARRADAVIEAALAWLSTAPSRFFLWVHLYDPHAPYDAPGGLRGLLARSPYDAEVSFADEQIGRLVGAIDSRWPSGGTLFAVASDHGESLGEHDEDYHAYSIYDATQRVPLILTGADLPRGYVVGAQVRLADVTPTLLALVEAAPLGEIDGRDLAPLWSGTEEEPRVALVETVDTRLHFGWSPLFGVRTSRYKYIRAPRPELYDLRLDPAETRNLARQKPSLLAELDEELTGLLAAGRPFEITRLDPSRRAQLERLGYVAPDRDSGGLSLEVGGPDPKDHLAEVSTFRAAKQHLRSGRPLETLNLLRRLPNSELVATLRSDAALAAGRAELAERYARSAPCSAGRCFPVYMSLGNALMLQGRLEEARSAFDDAARLNPPSPEPWVGLGLVAERLGAQDDAENLYRRAVQTSRASPEARWLLAALLIETQRQEEAESFLSEVAPDLLEQPTAAARLAEAELRVGRRRHALARLEVSRRRFPESPILKRALSMIRRERVPAPPGP